MGSGTFCVWDPSNYASYSGYSSTGQIKGSRTVQLGTYITLIQEPTASINDLSGNVGPTYPSAGSGGVQPQSSFSLYSAWGSCPDSCVAKVVFQCTKSNGFVLVSNAIWSATYTNGFVTLINQY